MATYFFSSLTRKKTIVDGGSPLARVMTLIDLVGLGVGSTLGLGVYMLAGEVAKENAGPAACISFLVAAIASAFAGLCYAEFAARVPKAGSAYVYSYVSVGELVAYTIGWNLILEYAIGTASVARGMSGYIDFLADNQMGTELNRTMGMHVSFLAPHPDFLSFGFVVLLTVLLSIGVKESSRLNNIFTGVNLVTISIIIVSGAIKAKPSYWNISKNDIPLNFREKAGSGGFTPFGIAGIMSGAAKCFYGFVGFDAVATTGEEAKNPQRNIPLAIVISLVIIFLTYFAISTVLTMMLPYYDQDTNAPFLYAFEQIDLIAIKWIVSIGAIVALCTSLLGAMFPLPRVIYAMANDGLIFKSLARINKKTQTPIVATALSGLLVGIMAVMFDTRQLMNMMSIGTLLAYTIVAVCVLILRYQYDPSAEYAVSDEKKQLSVERSLYNLFRECFNLNMNKTPSLRSTQITNWSIVLFSIFAGGFDAIVIYAIDYFDQAYVIVPFVIVAMIMLCFVVIIARQPVDEKKLSFKVPWVPGLPCLSILVNLYLMLELDGMTWVRFVVWLFIGFCIYFFYGLKNSEEKKLRKKIQDDKHDAANAPESIKRESLTNNSQDTKF